MNHSDTKKADPSTGEYAPDGIWREWAVDLQVRAHSLRELRATLMAMAYWLTEHEDHRGLVLLIGSRLSRNRVAEELKRARRALRPGVSGRIHVLSTPEKGKVGTVAAELHLDEGDQHAFGSWIEDLVATASRPRKPRNSLDLVFEVVLNQWMLNKGPMTTKWIMKTTGLSYPPVATALKKLEPAIKRHSNRSVELAHFPRQEWSRYLSAAERAGLGYRYQPHSKLARSPDAMLDRVESLNYPGIAISGVHAARHYHPDIDLVGTPRLDLCIHSPQGKADVDFVDSLDPALQFVSGRSEGAPALVVWPIYRDASLFESNPEGKPWADPVSCLLALHDARLESQAGEFLNQILASHKEFGPDD